MSVPCSLCKLPSGREVVLAVPEPDRDVHAFMRFVGRLSQNETALVPYDVDDSEVVRSKMLEVYHQDHWRLVALVDDEIVAAGLLDRRPERWLRHVATLRVMLDHRAGEIGIRRLLCDKLVSFARVAEVEKLSTHVLSGDPELLAFYERQGFQRELVRKRLAKDTLGKLHDVVTLSSDLERVWHHLEDSLHDLDVAITRLSGMY